VDYIGMVSTKLKSTYYKKVKKGSLTINKKGVKKKNRKVICSLNEANIYKYLKKKLK